MQLTYTSAEGQASAIKKFLLENCGMFKCSGESKGLGHKIPPSLHKAGQSPAGSKQSQREPCLQLHLPVLPIQERGCQLYETKASHL